jgi:hypothetical protein
MARQVVMLGNELCSFSHGWLNVPVRTRPVSRQRLLNTNTRITPTSMRYNYINMKAVEGAIAAIDSRKLREHFT